jgi:hypothetical protein
MSSSTHLIPWAGSAENVLVVGPHFHLQLYSLHRLYGFYSLCPRVLTNGLQNLRQGHLYRRLGEGHVHLSQPDQLIGPVGEKEDDIGASMWFGVVRQLWRELYRTGSTQSNYSAFTCAKPWIRFLHCIPNFQNR